jgi:hypothetical protein
VLRVSLTQKRVALNEDRQNTRDRRNQPGLFAYPKKFHGEDETDLQNGASIPQPSHRRKEQPERGKHRSKGADEKHRAYADKLPN